MFTERAFSFTYLNHGKTSYTITNTGETRQIKHHITCDSTNLTYMIQWKRCKKQYIDETKCTLHERFKEHRQATNNPLHSNGTTRVPSHFNRQPGHTIADMELIPLELQPTLSMSRRKARLRSVPHRERQNPVTRRSEPKERTLNCFYFYF